MFDFQSIGAGWQKGNSEFAVVIGGCIPDGSRVFINYPYRDTLDSSPRSIEDGTPD
jgi:hypothetical protein